jgi:hypothetical protein
MSIASRKKVKIFRNKGKERTLNWTSANKKKIEKNLRKKYIKQHHN